MIGLNPGRIGIVNGMVKVHQGQDLIATRPGCRVRSIRGTRWSNR